MFLGSLIPIPVSLSRKTESLTAKIRKIGQSRGCFFDNVFRSENFTQYVFGLADHDSRASFWKKRYQKIIPLIVQISGFAARDSVFRESDPKIVISDPQDTPSGFFTANHDIKKLPLI